jgi:plastocyanin
MHLPFSPRFRRLTTFVCLVVLLLFTACAPAPAATANPAAPAASPTAAMVMQPPAASTPLAVPVTAGPRVTISNFTFSPASLTVPVGTTVTWINQDDTAHTVTSVDQKFGSQALDTGDTFTFKFTAPGAYAYFCTLHPQMVGKIIVQ